MDPIASLSSNLDDAALVKDVQRALVAVISCFMLGQNTDWEALASMVKEPEWELWRCCRTSSRRETAIGGLSPWRTTWFIRRRFCR